MNARAPAMSQEAQVSEAIDAALPAIIMDARRAAISIVMGDHGRRRAGAGDAFWQHREWTNGESVRQIDWRRSARSDKLFVRERERQVPALLQVWCDHRSGMDWQSDARLPTKAQRGLVLGLALGIATKSGGERVCAIGPNAPLTNELLFAHILINAGTSFPDRILAGQVVIVSDGLEAPQVWQQRAKAVRSARAELIVVLVADPAEAAFPYQGRVSFTASSGAAPVIVGRAQSAQSDYQSAYKQHIESVATAIKDAGGQVFFHATKEPVMPVLLTLARALDGAMPRSSVT
jgi:uncharacterized protein (DUF58 family)